MAACTWLLQTVTKVCYYGHASACAADPLLLYLLPIPQRHRLLHRFLLYSRIKDILEFLLPQVSPEELSATNQSGNTPLHWAAMNGHIDTLRLLVPALPKDALFLKNQFGRDALSEAENAVPEGEKAAASPQQECVGYLLTFMEIEKDKEGKEEDIEEPAAEGDRGKDSAPSATMKEANPGSQDVNGAETSTQ